MPLELFLNIISPEIEQNGGPPKKELEKMPEFYLYASSCFLYFLAGLIRIRQKEYLDGSNLIICSFFSYMSDVHTMGVKSYWHIIDRYFALIISIYHFYSLKTRKSFAINMVLFVLGIIFLKRSQKMYANHQKDFLLEHTKWHMIGPIMALTSNI